MNTQLILVGGGGHCKSCIDVIEQCTGYTIAGILDQQDEVGKKILGYSIIGTDDDVPRLTAGHKFLITVGQIKSAGVRKKLFEMIGAAGGTFATIVSPRACVSAHSAISEGTIVMHRATVNAGAIIGRNCIINTGANIEHDCSVGDHTHISTHAVLNGDSSVGAGSFIGSNAVLVHGVSVASGVAIGAGAVVHKHVTEAGVYVGNPFRPLK